MRLLRFAFAVLVAPACHEGSEQVTCGAGTLRVGTVCVPTDADASPPTDAGPPSPPPTDGGLGVVPIDWTRERGAPVAMSTVGTFTGRLFAVTDDRVLLQSGDACTSDGLGVSVCDYSWIDDGGRTTARAIAQASYAAAAVSRDGAALALVDGSDVSTCGPTAQLTGSAGLYDARTGQRVWTGAAGTMPSLARSQAFSPFGNWLFAPVPTPGGIPCPSGTMVPVSRSPPVGAPSIVSEGVELADGRWVVPRPATGAATALGTIDPRSANSFAPFAIGTFYAPFVASARRDWVHVLSYADPESTSVQLTSFNRAVANGTATTSAVPTDRYLVESAGRWLLTCSVTQVAFRRCLVRDATGTVADVVFDVADGIDPVLLPEANSLLFRAPGQAVLTLHDLVGATRGLTPVAARMTSLRLMGNGSVVIAVTPSAEAWAVGRTGAKLLAKGVENTWMVPATGVFGDDLVGVPTGSEDLLLLTHQGKNGALALDMWDARSGALVALSDHIVAGSPGERDCGSPSLVYSARGGGQRGGQPSKYVFFAELTEQDSSQATLFVLPSDRTAPPRAVGATPVAACRAPVVSNSGKRVGVWLHNAVTSGDAIAVGTL